ncbi:Uncharacterized protein TPAR_01241 [Tolypocladium paradoxum]|uniref:Bacteriophage T5 Orf172 DNA-binding domain-containing protein n=1 Tax=Tolypocladium paradoxum TaxID=94208 RepID=A0A2S4L7Y5_9HYPO|nr:Uncharacterized protein TPAR_01241 [Tolypocladium paradoxum]
MFQPRAGGADADQVGWFEGDLLDAVTPLEAAIMHEGNNGCKWYSNGVQSRCSRCKSWTREQTALPALHGPLYTVEGFFDFGISYDRPGLLDPSSISPTPRLSSTKAKRARNTSSASPGRGAITRNRSHSLAQPSPSATTDAGPRPLEPSSEHEADATSHSEVSTEPQDDCQTPPVLTTPSSAVRKSSAAKEDGPIASWRVDGKLEDALSEISKQDATKLPKEGYNYVFRIVGTDIIKIGITTGRVDARLRRISRECIHGTIETLNVNQRPIGELKRAEKLIKAELHNFLYQFDCVCRRGHVEYFKVDKEVALDITRRWTAFCEAEPWDKSGALRPFWKDLFCLPGKECHWQR